MFVVDSDYLFVSIVMKNDHRKVGNFDPHLDDWEAMNFYDMLCMSSKATTMEWTGEKIKGFTFLSGSRYYQNQLPYGREGGEFKVIPAVIDEVEVFTSYMRPIVLASHYLDKAWNRYKVASTKKDEATAEESYFVFYNFLKKKIEEHGWYVIKTDTGMHSVFKANQSTTVNFTESKWELLNTMPLTTIGVFNTEHDLRVAKAQID